MIPLCKNCKYKKNEPRCVESGDWYNGGLDYCLKTKYEIENISLVYGKTKRVKMSMCEDVRERQSLCGKEGKWFKPNLFTAIIQLFRK